MSPLTFYIVDVFAEEKYAGNQLAVVVNAGSLSSKEMQQIAKEMNYSETTFILSSELQSGGYDVRIFTPAKELPFAGHPTLGTAFILQQEIIQQAVETITLNLKVGQIPVSILYKDNLADVLWMQQRSPVFGETFSAEAIAPVLNLDLSDIDLNFPIQDVSTGVPFIIVPLKTHQALKQSKVNKDRYFALIEKTQAKEILVFCPETYHPENQLSVRVFADSLGIPEDPATGSANGCLAGYLVEHRYFDRPSIDLRVEQGYEIGRPSLLLLRAAKTDTKIQVSVGGRVILVARGEFV
ncbi:MAG: PhzF family phenazine biosynthesis protein [Leptolyngbya sp. BL-A-14]